MLKSSRNVIGQIKRLKGALRSGSPAARLGILLKAIGPLSRILDRMMYYLLKTNEVEQVDLPPCLMIVSPPRSGSTVIYQMVVRTIPCVYFSNLHFLFANYASSYMLKNGLFGTTLSGIHNYYGYTPSLFDVNEGNEIVEAIVRKDANKEQVRNRFAKFAKVMRATRNKPLIFKNVRAYPNLLRMHLAIPEIVFLQIKRNPEKIIQSVVRAHRELGTFHPIPKGLVNCNINDPVEFAVRQVLEIEGSIDHQKQKIDQTAWLEWHYEDFCSDPLPMIENLTENYLKMDLSCLRRDALPEIKASNRIKVEENEALRISMLLRQHTDAESQNGMQ